MRFPCPEGREVAAGSATYRHGGGAPIYSAATPAAWRYWRRCNGLGRVSSTYRRRSRNVLWVPIIDSGPAPGVGG